MPPTDPFGDEHTSPILHPSHLTGYSHRPPSPGQPLEPGYQLSDNPYTYAPQSHLVMPSSDRLAEQPTVSIMR